MSLETVLGQARAKRFLKKLCHSGQVPHALLFSGMAGVGKSAMAFEFGKLLNCRAPVEADSCGRCDSCLKMEHGSHPDLIRVKPDGVFIKLEQIRDLRERLRFRPFEGQWRIIIIDGAQSLREEAGNALLKMLEEPPGRNIFVLTALEAQMLLPTIVSRCCHVRFQPLDRESLAQRMEREHQVPASKAREVAKLADGSLERALWLSDADRMEQWKDILSKIEGLAEGNMLDFFPLVTEWVQKSETLEQDLECIKLWMHGVILCRLLDDHQPFFPPDRRTRQAAAHARIDTLFSLYERTERALHQLRQNANKNLVVEGVCLAIKDSLYGKGRWDSLSQRRQNLPF